MKVVGVQIAYCLENSMKRLTTIAEILTILGTVSLAMAQNNGLTLNWWKIGPGGRSAGRGYTLGSASDQHDAGGVVGATIPNRS